MKKYVASLVIFSSAFVLGAVVGGVGMASYVQKNYLERSALTDLVRDRSELTVIRMFLEVSELIKSRDVSTAEKKIDLYGGVLIQGVKVNIVDAGYKQLLDEAHVVTYAEVQDEAIELIKKYDDLKHETSQSTAALQLRNLGSE